MTQKQTLAVADQFCLPASFTNPSSECSLAFKFLSQAAPPAHGAPQIISVVAGALKTLKAALGLISDHNEQAEKILGYFESLHEHCSSQLDKNNLLSIDSALTGTKTRHPEWSQFAVVSRTKSHPLADSFLGLKLLIAIQDEKRIPFSALQRAKQLYKEEALTKSQVIEFIYGSTPDEFVGQSWPRDLMRSWRRAVELYSSKPTPTPPSPQERVSGQLVNSMIHGHAALSAGATTDRQLSHGQTQSAFMHIKRELAADSLQGAAGLLVSITSFSVDVVCELPLNLLETGVDWLIHIDVQQGVLCIDYKTLVLDAAKPIPGCLPSSFILKKPLPSDFVKNLQARLRQYPEAKTLSDLYPGEKTPIHDSQIYGGKHGIAPTWPRLRKTCSRVLRERGMNIHVVSIVTGDFSIVPRSKLYYASVSQDEISAGMNELYRLAGWGEAYSIHAPLYFGSQVVPAHERVNTVDQHLIDFLNSMRPGRNATAPSLIHFHNAFANVTGFRLSILFALREAREINLLADIDELEDAWAPVHDKIVPNDSGWMPMPLCKFSRNCIIAWRNHCKAMLRRFIHLGQEGSDFARWCAAVKNRKSVALLACADEAGQVRPLASHDFIGKDESTQPLTADFGRKIQENILRHFDMKSTEIDAILRHRQQGQSHSTNTSDFNFQTLRARFETAMESYCDRTFGNVINGLLKECK